MYELTPTQVKNMLLFLNRVETKGFKEAEALMSIFHTIKEQERAIMEEKGGK